MSDPYEKQAAELKLVVAARVVFSTPNEDLFCLPANRITKRIEIFMKNASSDLTLLDMLI